MPEGLTPKQILEFQKKLPAGLPEVEILLIAEIPQIIRRPRIEDCEGIQLIAEQGINVDRPPEVVVFRDKTEKEPRSELVRRVGTHDISVEQEASC